jgi:hypothetical protein
MTTDAIRSTAFELSDIARKLSAIEVLGTRRRTPANARQIVEWAEVLETFDRTDVRLAKSLGVDLRAICRAGTAQLRPIIASAYAAALPHPMEGATK